MKCHVATETSNQLNLQFEKKITNLVHNELKLDSMLPRKMIQPLNVIDPQTYNANNLDLNYDGATILGRLFEIGGTVQTAKHIPSKTIVAVKKYTLEKTDTLTETSDFYDLAKSIQYEVVSMRQLRHPNLLPCLSSFVSGFQVFVVTPLIAHKSARDILDNCFRDGLPELVIASILRDVLKGLHHLHSQAIVHRSVRSSHILINENGRACLSGLRYSCSLMEIGQGLQDRYDFPLFVAKSNLNWLSPEMISQNLLGYNEKTDIYSLGVTACEMANGVVPYSDIPGTLMLLEKLRGSSPKALDSTTFDPGRINKVFQEDLDEEHYRNNVGQFLGNQPVDSGVGASVGSTTNVQAGISGNTLNELKNRESIYSTRRFTNLLHRFVADSTILDVNQRPSALVLAHHPFIKQVKKAGPNFSVISHLKESCQGSMGLLVSCEKLSSDFNSQLKLNQNEESVEWEFD